MKRALFMAALMIASGPASALCPTPLSEPCSIDFDPIISPNVTVPPPIGILSADDRSWHLLTQTFGGTITLLRDLTKHECEFAMHRANGEPATEDEATAQAQAQAQAAEDRAAAHAKWIGSHPKCKDFDNLTTPNGQYPDKFSECIMEPGKLISAFQSRTVNPGDIRSAECFQ